MPGETDCALLEEEPLALLDTSTGEVSPAEAVIIRVLGGETEAFEELMILTENQILGVAWKILRDRDLARDAAQESYLRIFRSLGRFRIGESFQAWMYRIAVNVCYDLAKKRGPSMASTEILETIPHAHPGSEHAENAMLLRQRLAMVRQALDTLSPAERNALVLRDLEGLKTEEVARILGVRPVTVRSQISSARGKVQHFCARLMSRKLGGLP